MKKTDPEIMIEALQILAEEIISQDGVANACIYEASIMIQDLLNEIETLKKQKPIFGNN